MRVAVIGGGGFVGRNVMEAFDDAFAIEKDDALGRICDADVVVHLAANADVRKGWVYPYRDLYAGPLLTQKVLEAMRYHGVRRIVFASTGSVYHPAAHAHHEHCPVHATSLYAASKIAAEQLICAYAEAGHVEATVLRFVSILGPHYSHGLVKDFVGKLHDDMGTLPIIAPGTSRKSYVHVDDVVNAIQTVLAFDFASPFRVFNVGTDQVATPTQIGEWVIDEMGLDAKIVYEGETWVGDNPAIMLDTSELQRLGWKPRHTIEEAVRDTVRWLT